MANRGARKQPPTAVQQNHHHHQHPIASPPPASSSPTLAPVALVLSPTPRLDKERHPRLRKADYIALVEKCQQLERRVFPKSEAMELAKEIRKPNQYLFAVLQFEPPLADTSSSNERPYQLPLLLSYGVLALGKIDSTAKISKVCTDPCYRRKGAGELLVRSMLDMLGSQKMSIDTVQLHVDRDRTDAIRLYDRCGFNVRAEISNYYAPGRDALLMAAHVSRNN